MSTVTEAQLFEVLQRPYFAPRVAQSFISGVRAIFAAAELVTITERIVACRDPMDDMFLELAINGRADMRVTGDLDLLILSPFRGLPIITPRVFIQEIGRDTCRSTVGPSWSKLPPEARRAELTINTFALGESICTGYDCISGQASSNAVGNPIERWKVSHAIAPLG